MVYNWQNDENLSGKSDNDYVLEIIESLTMELLADPRDPRNLFLRGNGYLDLGQFGEAIDDYTKIIDSGKADPPVFNNRGISYRGLGEAQLAIDDLTTAISLDVNYRDAYNLSLIHI